MRVKFYNPESGSTISDGEWPCIPREGEYVNFHQDRWRVDNVEWGRLPLCSGSDHEDPDMPIAFVALVDKEEV